MKTTEFQTPSVVMRAAVAAAAAGVVLVVVAGLASGAPAARGAVVGSLIAVGVFAFGGFAVDAVSRLMPAASLMFAMLTYTLQVVVMAMAFVAVNRSGMLERDVDRNWLGAAIIVGAFVWMTVQIRLATTTRIPVYEPVSHEAPEGGAR